MNVATILKAKGRSVATVRPDTKLQDVVAKLSQRRIGAVVVVGEEGSVAGIISERDVIRALAEAGPLALEQPVSRYMTSDVVVCRETSLVDELMEMMTAGRFRHLPVVEDNSLVGIVSIGDIVKSHLSEVEMEVSAMRDYLATG
jgi:CBS domain-containing protein